MVCGFLLGKTARPVEDLLGSREHFALFPKLASGGGDYGLAVDVDLLARSDRPLHILFADEVVNPAVADAVR